jgi:tetratricopeptide (TPR) repeat protein
MNRHVKRRGAGLRPLGRGLLAAVFLSTAGCKSAAGPGALETAVADYRSGRYVQAQEEALRAHRTLHGTEAGQAAYVAGLCAYQRADLEGARQWLSRAADSADPTTRGQAQAALGLTLERQGRHREAAARFEQAAAALDGPDARQAAFHAGLAHQAGGEERRARQWFGEAESPGGSYGFTLQVGAFRDRRRAEQAAGEAGALAQRHGLGRVRIVPRTDGRGHTLYLVHLGRFATRNEATEARGRLGQLQLIVATATPPA